jgi:hypothetical protein
MKEGGNACKSERKISMNQVEESQVREKVRNEISRHCNKNKLRRERERPSNGYFSRELRMSSPPFLTRSVFYERATWTTCTYRQVQFSVDRLPLSVGQRSHPTLRKIADSLKVAKRNSLQLRGMTQRAAVADSQEDWLTTNSDNWQSRGIVGGQEVSRTEKKNRWQPTGKFIR